jgi:uncharacterized membrane protein YhhN
VSGEMLGIVATLVCLGALAGLVRAEIRRDRPGRFLWKPIASLGFVAVPLVTGALGGDGVEVARWVFAGLVLGAIGDVLLMFDAERAFLGGLVAFLLGHLAYVIAFARIIPPARWAEGAMLAVVAATLVAAAVVLRWLWPRLGAMRIPVIGYVAVITAMVVGGIAVSVHGTAVEPRAALLSTAGAIAFYASDLAVARDKFVAKDVWNRAIGLPLYYGAQLLIAWSVVTAA